MGAIVGIDLGTTNSVGACWRVAGLKVHDQSLKAAAPSFVVVTAGSRSCWLDRLPGRHWC